MHKNKKQVLTKVLTIIFLIALITVSFEKEKHNIQAKQQELDLEYSDEELNAEIIFNNAPEWVKHTESYRILITVKNCGSAIWSNEEDIRLCIWQDDMDYGFRVNIPKGIEVHQGDEWTFELDGFMLPEASQTKLEFQMVKENVVYFGEREAAIIMAVD